MTTPVTRSLLALAATLTLVSASDAAEPSRGCVTLRPDTRYDGAGYSHLATIESACSSDVHCELWTDVDPPPQVAELLPGDRVDVLFRRGSPAYQFHVFARCAFR